MESNGEDLKDLGKPRKGKRPLSLLDRTIQAAVADKRALGADDDPARELYPELWDWLTRTEAGSGLIITGAKLVVTASPGGFVLTINHADMGISVGAETVHLGELLAAMEAVLADARTIPKPWGKKQPTARRRKPII